MPRDELRPTGRKPLDRLVRVSLGLERALPIVLRVRVRTGADRLVRVWIGDVRDVRLRVGSVRLRIGDVRVVRLLVGTVRVERVGTVRVRPIVERLRPLVPPNTRGVDRLGLLRRMARLAELREMPREAREALRWLELRCTEREREELPRLDFRREWSPASERAGSNSRTRATRTVGANLIGYLLGSRTHHHTP